MQGSGQVPYKIKRVDENVYSCTCPGKRRRMATDWEVQALTPFVFVAGWTMNIKKRGGVEHSTCKHIREAIGDATENARLSANAGEGDIAVAAAGGPAAAAREAKASSAGGDKNPAIVRKVSLASKWEERIDPTGWMLSEK
jgi:hypothetical protein